MDWVIFGCVAVVLLVIGYIAQHKGWIDMTNKARRSGSGGMMGGLDEVFHPTRHEAQIELERQAVLPAPAPIPGDGDLGIYDGRVRIELSDETDGTDPEQRGAGRRDGFDTA